MLEANVKSCRSLGPHLLLRLRLLLKTRAAAGLGRPSSPRRSTAPAAMSRLSSQPARAVEMTHSRARQNLGLHQSRVHSHAVNALVHFRPVSDTAAMLAAVKLVRLRTPHVDVGRLTRHVYLFRRVIGPQDAVAPTDAAVAIRDFLGRATDFQVHRAAMT